MDSALLSGEGKNGLITLLQYYKKTIALLRQQNSTLAKELNNTKVELGESKKKSISLEFSTIKNHSISLVSKKDKPRKDVCTQCSLDEFSYENTLGLDTEMNADCSSLRRKSYSSTTIERRKSQVEKRIKNNVSSVVSKPALKRDTKQKNANIPNERRKKPVEIPLTETEEVRRYSSPDYSQYTATKETKDAARRRRSSIGFSYREPGLRHKLRQGDPNTFGIDEIRAAKERVKRAKEKLRPAKAMSSIAEADNQSTHESENIIHRQEEEEEREMIRSFKEAVPFFLRKRKSGLNYKEPPLNTKLRQARNNNKHP